MIKQLKSLGDTWYEVTGTALLLILFLPLLLCLAIIIAPFLLSQYLWDWLRKAPQPTVPEVVGTLNDDMETKDVIDRYLTSARLSIKHLHIEADKPSGFMNSYKLSSEKTTDLHINLYYNAYMTGISVDGVRSGYWHTEEDDSLDLYFWLMIAILRYGLFPSKSFLGFKQYWICVDELDVWAKLSPERPAFIESSFAFYREPPKNVTKAFSELAVRTKN